MYDMVNDSLEAERKVIEKQKQILKQQQKDISEKEIRINKLNTDLKFKLELIKEKEKDLEEYSIKISQKIYRNYRNKKKANKILEAKNEKITRQKNIIQEQNEELNQLVEEVTSQKDEIEAQRDLVQIQKNKIEVIYSEITQSIDYAMRIQQSVLPEQDVLIKYFSDFFVMFNPKDKVSGDFYWWKNIGDITIVSAADCTGHGVPGAFMSMLGSTFLNEIINSDNNITTGEILNILRTKIIETLKQKGRTGEQKDGMDMAIISINHKTNIVQFSGANNPLYIVAKSIKGLKPLMDYRVLGLYEIKPNKMPISIYEKMDNFTTHEIQLDKGDSIYMFSDGFADQFGGPKDKKFKYKGFKQLLVDNVEKPMSEQKQILEKAFNNWKGKAEQVDDVVIVGIKL